jgi:hypothetical protein
MSNISVQAFRQRAIDKQREGEARGRHGVKLR